MNKKHSKAYQTIKEKVSAESYSLNDAIQFLINNKIGKADQTVELHLKLNLKKGKEKAIFRAIVTPPTPIAKLPRLAVLADKFATSDKNINTDSTKILAAIKKGKVDFDILIATPEFIAKLQPFGKFLGPKGLMPTEKAGTLTDKPEETAANFLKGQKTLVADDSDNLHVPCGKLSLGVEKIIENINYLLEEIKHHKPAGIKGELILKATLCTTHSPSLNLELSK
jgi:large subunit ribosomal protein L1